MNSSKYDSPCVLISSVSVPRGGATPLNFAAMAKRSRGWLKISEIQFSIDPGIILNRTSVNGLSPGDQYGGLINVDCGVGRHRMTNGQIPVWLLGPRLSVFGEYGQQTYLNSPNTGLGGTNRMPVINNYTWRLPKPMLVPPGTSLGMLITRPSELLLDGATPLPNAMTVEVSAKGVQLAKPPKNRETDIPYVTYFRGPYLNPTALLLECGQGFATGNSLANPFNKPLMVERFTQRTAFGFNATSPQSAGDFQWYYGNIGSLTGGPSNIRLRIFQNHYEVMSETQPSPQNFGGAPTVLDNPQGKAIIDSVFNPQWATWRVGQELASKEWFNAELSANLPFYSAANWNVVPQVAMVGSRKEHV